MMMGCALVMFFILTSSMVVQLTSMSPYAAPLSLLLSPPVLHVLAWVAAAAGEVAKDEKHLAAVEKVGSDFIPLVVKTFGVWTPFALKTLEYS